MDINNYFLLFPVLLPIIAGVLLMFIKFGKREHMQLYILLILVIDLASIGWIALQPEDTLTLSQFFIAEGLHVFFHVDMLSKIFSVLIAFVWLMVGIASFEYMAHEKNEQRFYCFYLVVGGALSALAFSGNLLTMYVFYEMMTLTSMPLVMHNLSHEAIMAGLKYLFYSVAGAFMVLFGFFLFNAEGRVLYFAPGGIINEPNPSGIMLFAVFLMIIGFGTKAGMLPMHGWLPTAHPVAPAPASAVLSGVITKAGVLGIIRSVYYVAGPDMIKGTWVQYTWIILSILTIFMGSMMAYKEKVLKARDIDTRVTGRTTGHPVRALRNEMTKKYLEMEAAGATAEELEYLTLGGLRKAVVEGDVKNGSVMSGQIAGLVKDELPCKEVVENVMAETEKVLKGAAKYE